MHIHFEDNDREFALDAGWSEKVSVLLGYGMIEATGNLVIRIPYDKQHAEKKLIEMSKSFANTFLKAGKYEVTNMDLDGFSVGCEKVTWEQFEAIAAARKARELYK